MLVRTVGAQLLADLVQVGAADNPDSDILWVSMLLKNWKIGNCNRVSYLAELLHKLQHLISGFLLTGWLNDRSPMPSNVHSVAPSACHPHQTARSSWTASWR